MFDMNLEKKRELMAKVRKEFNIFISYGDSNRKLTKWDAFFTTILLILLFLSIIIYIFVTG